MLALRSATTVRWTGGVGRERDGFGRRGEEEVHVQGKDGSRVYVG